MGSVGDGEGNSKGGNLIVDVSDTETQAFDTQSPSSSSSSGEKLKDVNADELHLFQSTVPFDDTIPLENSPIETQLVNHDGETQVVDYPDWVEDMTTQLLDVCEKELVIDSDDEGTDRTEVLTDVAEVSDDESEGGIGDNPVGLEKRQLSPPNNQGSLPRGSSDHAASLQASILAAHSLTPEEAHTGPSSNLCSYQSGKEHDHPDHGISGIRYPAAIDTKVREVDRGHDTWKCNGNVKRHRDETECRVGNPTVRKLFNDVTLLGNGGSNSIIEGKNGGTGERDLPLLLARDHEFAGLSYVGSQEPGELSQANALDIVDRFLSVNNVELSQEVYPGTTMKGKSPPVMNARGPQSLVKRPNLRSPVGESAVFDWVDSREDEGGGDFFTKKKELLFERGGHGRRSLTQPQNSRNKIGKGLVDKFRQREEDLNLHQKIMGFSHSDSRLMLHNSKEVQIPETKTKKRLAKELDRQINEESPGKKLEVPAIGKDTPDVYDVGFDTQMAAEAMEALFCGNSADHEVDDAHQGPQNANENSPTGVIKKKSHSRHVSLCKKSCPDSGITTRQSKRAKILDAKLSKETVNPSRKCCKNPRVKKVYPDSEVKTKVNGGKLKGQQPLDSWNAANGNESSRRRFSKFVKQRKTVGVMDRACVKDVGRCHSSSTSHGHLSYGKGQLEGDSRTFSPVAHRTRQCTAVNPMKRTDDSGKGKADLMEVGVHGSKRKRNSLGDAASKSLLHKGMDSKLSFNHVEVGKDKVSQEEQPGLGRPNGEIAATTSCAKRDALSYPRGRRTRRNISNNLNEVGNLDDAAFKSLLPHVEVGKDKVGQQEQPGLGRPNVEIAATTSSARRDALSYPRGRRTRRNISNNLNEVGNLDGPSTMIDGKEANEQFAAGGKRSQDKVSTTYVKLDMKRKTRSTIYPHPFLSSPERNSEENLAWKNSVDSGSADAAVNCVSAVTSGKMLSKDLVGAKAAQHSDRKDYSTEGAEVNAKLEASPTEKVKTTCSACNTPINAASPVCLGNEYHKQSCRKSLLRSSLMKELIRLDASEALPTPALKDLRRRRDISNVRVLFSHHLDEDIVKQQKKILARLGVSIASSSADATHFVADKFVRTRNMLEAIALGKSVVTHLWLESCGQASCFIDEKNYILRDSKKEKEIGFSMPVSLAHASQHPLLQGKRVFVTPNVKPGKQLIAGLVKAVHGQAVERFGRSAMKDDKIPDDLLILSCEEDYLICMPLLEKGASVYSSELLLNGIVIQKLEYERHRLFMDHVKKTRSTIWLRKDGNQFLPVTKCK